MTDLPPFRSGPELLNASGKIENGIASRHHRIPGVGGGGEEKGVKQPGVFETEMVGVWDGGDSGG